MHSICRSAACCARCACCLQRPRRWARCASLPLPWARPACSTSTSATMPWERRASAPLQPPSASRCGARVGAVCGAQTAAAPSCHFLQEVRTRYAELLICWLLTARMPARPAGEPGKHRLPERRLLGARLRGAGRADGQHGAPAPPAPVQQHERLRGGGLHCTVSWRGVGGRSSWRAQSLVHSCYAR